MKGTQRLALNKKCWDTVAPYFFQVDCLPKYGPYTASEDEIHLFDSIRNKKVLDIGCGSGLSGECISNRGHHWIGCDISPSMLNIAVQVLKAPHFLCRMMLKEM